MGESKPKGGEVVVCCRVRYLKHIKMGYIAVSILKEIIFILEFWFTLLIISILLADYEGAGVIILISLTCLNRTQRFRSITKTIFNVFERILSIFLTIFILALMISHNADYGFNCTCRFANLSAIVHNKFENLCHTHI